ncbi:hypothetical protein DPMN_086643 [Dreissena polymorpha]|uniref:Uncharacterized protein n=1 Tax=Dreissena polymorpha TaxID=45954 RepID=A0A9D4FYB3_DREPO|nr:hypothetical protein DPMN_133664 [Dreissena polymorpha]KAH3844385.1 hypothetical protein DPMN_086643 [Dreissena polymorpha]
MISNSHVDDEDLKRKREASSVSEVDSSVNETPKIDKQKKKKPKQKSAAMQSEKVKHPEDDNDVVTHMKIINKKLEKLDSSMISVNKRLDNVIFKGDGTLHKTIKDLFAEMKDDLLKSVVKNIEVLEGRLFEKEQEIDKLKTQSQVLETDIKNQKEMNENLLKELKQIDMNRQKYENESEQYSRSNNIKIKGIADTNLRETAKQSAELVISVLRAHNVCQITMADINIAHRLPNKDNKNRDIIVSLISRQTKFDIIANRKQLKGTDIFINEDMTKLNLHVLMCVKKKMPDEINSAWFMNGKIFYKNHMDKIQTVKFEDYEHWTNLPWPNNTPKRE